jgi:hypothetical protein
MPSTTLTQTVPLGDLVAAVFDQAMGFSPTSTSEVATEVVNDMLLRTGNMRAWRALRALAMASK